MMNATDLFRIKLELADVLGFPEELIRLYCPDFDRLERRRENLEDLSVDKVSDVLFWWESAIRRVKERRQSIAIAFDEFMGNSYACPFCEVHKVSAGLFECERCTYAAVFGRCGESSQSAWDSAENWAMQHHDEVIDLSDDQRQEALEIIEKVREGLKDD